MGVNPLWRIFFSIFTRFLWNIHTLIRNSQPQKSAFLNEWEKILIQIKLHAAFWFKTRFFYILINMKKIWHLGTSINDVRRFPTIITPHPLMFDFYLLMSNFLCHFRPLKSDVINGRSLITYSWSLIEKFKKNLNKTLMLPETI